MDSVLIVAAEASSSLYAQRLLELWKKEGRSLQAFGVGSYDMEKLGFECVGRSEELAVVGFQEVLRHLPKIRRVYKSLLARVEELRPKFALLMDYPEFNLKIAKDLKARGVKVIYYISPQVWAWRRGRVHQIRKVVDQMLVLFPFEEPFYRDHGVPVSFVGHPLLDELPEELGSDAAKIRRQKHGIGENDIVLGLMPGSRHSEIQHHLKTQLETAAIMVRKFPQIRPLLMVAPTLEREQLQAAIGNFPFPIQIIKEKPNDMIQLADVILVASGTATLMVGLLQKPMVIMYRMNSLTAWMARKLVTATPFFGLANLVLGKRAVPELFQEEANPARLAQELARFINSPEERHRTVEQLGEIKKSLGSKGASGRVHAILNQYLDEKNG